MELSHQLNQRNSKKTWRSAFPPLQSHAISILWMNLIVPRIKLTRSNKQRL
jgi:hypothetical protein